MMGDLPVIDATTYRQVEANEACLVVFTKETCGVCKKLEPTMVKVANDYKDNDELNFYVMDVKDAESKKIFKELSLVGVPQTVFIKDGQVKETLPGAISEDILRKEIDDLLHPKEGFGAKLKGLFGKKS